MPAAPDKASDSQASPKAQLEQRYIELLEKRIAALELLTDKAASNVPVPTEDGHKNDDPGSEAKTPPKSPRIRRVIAKADPITGIRSDIPDEEDLKKNEDKAVTFRKVSPTQPGAKDGYCEADIVEGPLRNLLVEVIGEYPGQSWGGGVVNIQTPFFPLVHSWSKLEEAAAAESTGHEDDSEARKALQELLDVVKSSPELVPYFKTRESHAEAKVTTFETMWSLFKPGNLVYTKTFLGKAQLMVVEIAPYSWDRDRVPSQLIISCWCYDWNGKEVVKCYYDIPIQQFRGTKAVKDLPIYPVEYFQGNEENANEEELRRELLERGVRYNQLVREKKGASQMFQYSGEAVVDNINPLPSNNENTAATGDGFEDYIATVRDRLNQREKARRKTITVKGKILLDAGAFLTYGGGSLSLGDHSPYFVENSGLAEIKEIADNARSRAEKKDGQYSKDEKQFLEVLPPRFLGYSTKDKMWGQFKVDLTTMAPARNSDLFDCKLELEKRYKDMIRALVENHSIRYDPANKDAVTVTDVTTRATASGKGMGLVLLFHGPPGVGKTLTAETIAEATGKPLLVVSVAEIGLDASKAERNLEQMFSLASAWEAILLVDEADVFLESRSMQNPERNALVSVLLRVLEYYEGIMILTTNRITSLDVAVQSRIHLAVRYDDLTKSQKKAIFRQYLDQLEPDSIDNRSAIDDWIEETGSDYEFNGRQIRNLVQASLAVARSEKFDQRVSKKHLREVLAVYAKFSKDLEFTTKEARDANEPARSRR